MSGDAPIAGRFADKIGLIVGVANARSLAWAIASRLSDEGAGLVFAYRQERSKDRLLKLSSGLDVRAIVQCDASQPSDFVELASALRSSVPRLDFLVHSVAFADTADLHGRLLDTPKDRFLATINVSAYSLIEYVRAVEPLMAAAGGGSVVTLTYLGGERTVPDYNVMGAAKAGLVAIVRYLARDLGSQNIRVNAISAGPVSTLAARGVGSFNAIADATRTRSLLGRDVTGADVGAAAAYLLSDDALNVTATVLYVDAGYHAVGV